MMSARGVKTNGTSERGGWTIRLGWGALLGVRRGHYGRKADGGWVRVDCCFGDGCTGELEAGSPAGSLLFGILC